MPTYTASFAKAAFRLAFNQAAPSTLAGACHFNTFGTVIGYVASFATLTGAGDLKLFGPDVRGVRFLGDGIYQIRAEPEDGTVYWQGAAASARDAVQRALDSGLSLAGADLRATPLQGLSAAGADLREARMEESVVDGSDFTNASLGDVTMTSARAVSCSFRDADLSDASCDSVTFDGSDFTGATTDRLTATGASTVGITTDPSFGVDS